MQNLKKKGKRGFQDIMQTVTKESNCITNVCGDLTERSKRKGADLSNFENETVRLKAVGTIHKRCPLVDKSFPQRYGLIILKLLHMSTGIKQLIAAWWMMATRFLTVGVRGYRQPSGEARMIHVVMD